MLLIDEKVYTKKQCAYWCSRRNQVKYNYCKPKLAYLNKLFVRLAFTAFAFAFFRRCEHVFA